MALSNIFREPRRELTESAVGLIPIGIVFGSIWILTEALHRANPTTPFLICLILSFCLVLLGVFILVGVIMISHSLGEIICDSLQDAGIHLRPRNRR